MKRLIILSILILSGSAFAAVYNIGPGDEFGSLTLVDTDTLLMTGGEGEELTLGDWSTASIEDTNPLIGPNDGGIWDLNTYGYSELSISGGEINDLGGHDYSTINLSGGQILGDLIVYAPTTWIHIFGYDFNNNPFGGSPLTGFWADDTAFSINLVDSTISTYDQIVFHIIPEPATLILLALGAFVLRKKQ